jgi:hypothetical protein
MELVCRLVSSLVTVQWLGLADCGQIQNEMAALEFYHFAPDRESVFGADIVYYSKDVLQRQRSQPSSEERLQKILRFLDIDRKPTACPPPLPHMMWQWCRLSSSFKEGEG